MNIPEALRTRLAGIQRLALIAGGAGLVISLVGAFLSTEQFFRSYLFAYILVVAISLGCLAALMLQHLTGGRWGAVGRRVFEAGALTIPVMGVLLIPVLVGMGYLYPWMDPAEVAANEFVQHKTPYLNAPFFIIRAVLYFVIWGGMAYLLNRWSAEEDRTGDPALGRRMRTLSGPGLVVYVLTVTFAATDWGMSLEPEWFSTIYGVIYIVGHGLSALAFTAVVLWLLYGYEPLAGRASVDQIHDVGKLLFAFVVLWAYVNFSQFLIQWMGNIPEETPWYIHRSEGGWQYLAYALMLFQFALPFLILLSRYLKRTPYLLAVVASFILLMRAVDVFWLIMPSFYPDGFQISWLDITLPIGLGGLWVASFVWALGRKPLLPLHDPRVAQLREAHHPEVAAS